MQSNTSASTFMVPIMFVLFVHTVIEVLTCLSCEVLVKAGVALQVFLIFAPPHVL